MAERCDVIVIGGGVLGCFAARNLAKYRLKTILLERREDICTGISRANTAIVYSGCDTRPGTLKTEMCVRASQGMPELCKQLGVRYSRCGSLMICFGERGERVLQRKLEQGRVNGVRGIKMLTRDEVLSMEPNISPAVRSGLYAPDAGTLMPWELCVAAAENAVCNGAVIRLNSEVRAIERDGGGYRVTAGVGEYYTRGVVNCAGLLADRVHELAFEPAVRIVPSAGDYFVFDTKLQGCINHVIFHEPEERGKGLTLVPTADGNILAGPTDLPGDRGGGFKTAREGLELLRSLASEVIQALPDEHIIRSFGALRPNPYFVRTAQDGCCVIDDKSVSEFCILSQNGEPFFSLAGIKTPGLTCSNELGNYVAERLASMLGAELNLDFSPCRPAPVRLKDMAFDKRAELVTRRPEYGRIICRCGDVTEGEVIDSIRGLPGAVTLDGVKRRAGTGLGRCQGGFCAQRVTEILARELGVEPEQITKDGGGSYIFGE